MALQDAEARNQIRQMRNFILNEAKDKAQEIEAKTLEDFNIEKLKLVQQMKNKVRQEYQQKARQIEIERAIARSVLVNKYRLEKLTARHQIFEAVRTEAQQKLRELSDQKTKYKQLLAELIAQGAFNLLESQLVVRCRAEDQKLVQEALPIAVKLYVDVIRKETKVEKPLTIVIDETTFLPPGKPSGTAAKSCLGGVIVSSQNGLAVVDNTLDTRLELIMEQRMPVIRQILFPTAAKKA